MKTPGDLLTCSPLISVIMKIHEVQINKNETDITNLVIDRKRI